MNYKIVLQEARHRETIILEQLIITKSEEGIRLNKFIKKLYPTMPDSLIYKLIRKKYFKLNDKKVEGNEILNVDDRLSIFLGEETIEKFSKNDKSNFDVDYDCKKYIVYEDDNIIIFNKEIGLLSQSSAVGDLSVNTVLNAYLLKNDKSKIDNQLFTPSIINRLDRNTEGLIIFAKNYIAAREISKMISEGNLVKHYKTLVNGVVSKEKEELINLYKKDEKDNKAIICDYNENALLKDGFQIVKLVYTVIKRNSDSTILDIDLLTGKSHQIRAQLSHIGHPIVCDKKYMNLELYTENVKKYRRKSQDLKCYYIKFGIFVNDSLSYLNNKEFSIK